MVKYLLFLTKKIIGNDPDEPEQAEGESTEQQENIEDDIANMVLDDEMEQAAVKIQAAFRGKSSKKKETTTEGMKEFFLKKKVFKGIK